VPLALALPDVPDPDAVPDVDPLVDGVPPLDAPVAPLVLVAPVVPPGGCCAPVVPLEHATRTLQPNAAAEHKPMESSRFT
jgi:hypothetical protein